MNLSRAFRLVPLVIAAIALPVGAWMVLPRVPPMGKLPKLVSGGSRFPPSRLALEKQTLGPAPKEGHRPRISNVQILDFDRDGMLDVIACDGRANRVLLYRQSTRGKWEERVLGEDLLAPAHATVIDLDQDGDRDVVVSILGNLLADDRVIGRIVWLENEGDRFVPHVILDDVRRVADVQGADLDDDGDIDLAVAVFGYAHGQILWLENNGKQRFREHELLSAPGTIHVPLADYDGDGDLDIATVVSQDEEEVWGFENLGQGQFRPRRLYFSINYDLGSGGLVQTDLDGDGDPDLLLPVGDNLEDVYPFPQPYHGCLWLENRGEWEFKAKRIANFGGTYAAAPGDLDADGDQDVVLVSLDNEWQQPGYASIIWLENNGQQEFKSWQIADQPTHMITVACGDLNGDGRDDIVAGGMHSLPPYDRLGRITAWISRGDPAP